MARFMDVRNGFAGVTAGQLRGAHQRDLEVEAAEGVPVEHAWPGRAAGRRIMLRDGSEVLIRPVRSEDAALLADGFARLSPRSRRLRFLYTKDQLTPAELRYLTDIDHHHHEALAALGHPGGHGVGIARYVRDAGDPHAADIAITVTDDWQGRGLGAALLAQLARRARAEGIRRFTALISADNDAAAGLLRGVCARVTGREHGTVEYEITLAAGEEPCDGPLAALAR
jgi:RimJ/RimL family protein N-acetyltransferase